MQFRKEKRMIRKITGIILVLAGVVIGALLIVNHSPLMPHISGPVILIAVGILLLVFNSTKINAMNKKRIILVLIAAAVVVTAGVLIGVFGPELMNKLIEMHRGG
jgi:FtsH-binding integral membrane protein